MNLSRIPDGYIPAGYVGPVSLPGTGRVVFWTGRVAIGLRYQPPARQRDTAESETWIQDQLLRAAPRHLAS